MTVSHNYPDLKSLLAAIGQNAVEFLGVDLTEPNQRGIFGRAPIDVAITWGDISAVKLLLEAGAAVDVHQEFGMTPLHDAASFGHQEIVRLLLEHGASVNALNDLGQTPLDVARLGGHEAVAELLIRSLEGNVENKRK